MTEAETERAPTGSEMERQAVTVKDKTKTKGSVSQRKKDKSQADSCWRLHRDIGETSCHWLRYVRILLMLPCVCSALGVAEMKKPGSVLLIIRPARAAHNLEMHFFPPKYCDV